MPDVGGIAGDRLKSFIERIERLEEEKRALGSDIKKVFAEAKGSGFDTKIMRLLIKERRMDKDDRDEQEALLDVYKRALGMLVDTPLGDAAMARVGKAETRPFEDQVGDFEDRVGDKLEEIFEGRPDVTITRRKRAPRRTSVEQLPA